MRMIRDRFLRGLVLFGCAVWASTESLGAIHLMSRVPLLIFWSAIVAVLIARRPAAIPLPRFDWFVAVCAAAIVCILALSAITAAFSPPNSADAMAYHMPRVVYWAQQRSVAFFPTPYFNQVMLQPMAEYLMLHTYVLTGGDGFINFVQWFASVGSIVAVSSVAKEFGADARAQALAALFCATLPAGILASTGAKNDYFMAMWLALAVYFAMRRKVAYLGTALGLALLTKATAHLFAPWLLLAVLLFRRGWRRIVLAALIAVAINAPHYVRNYRLSGSIIGFDSASGDGVFRWRNESFGWRQTASNAMRNLSDQLGARSASWNRTVYAAVRSAHEALGISLNDPATTFRYSVFGPPVNANHEANAPDRWHLAILFTIACLLLCRAFQGRDLKRACYALAIVCAFLAFCGYLKWQPFFARLLLPLFVLASPLAGVIARPVWFQMAVCLFLLNNARPAIFENWVRPLKGPNSVLHADRSLQYFADMSQWNNRATYLKTVDAVARMNCDAIGIDIADLQLEYPLQALLRERTPGITFQHTGAACAVVCLNCAGDAKRLALYSGFRSAQIIDKFVVFSNSVGLRSQP